METPDTFSRTRKLLNSGIKSINNVYAIVNKVENVCVYQYIFDLIDNGVYVVYVLYSRTAHEYF
jgi:hypothetical protein